MVNRYLYKKDERNDFVDVNCHWWHAHDGVFLKHSHEDYYEVIICTQDHTHKINDLTFLQKVADVLIVAPKSEHEVSTDKGAEHYNVAVKKELFEKLTSNKDAIINELKEQGYLAVHLSDETFAFVKRCISKIDNSKISAFTLTLVETILSAVFLEFMEKKQEEDMFGSVSYYCRNAIEKIDNDTYIDKTLTQIYATYPLSHTAFIDEFKRIKGVTPNKYLAKRKLDYAKKLLLTSNKSVLEIAQETGYDSVSHFIKKFKSEYGETPLRFRKNYLKGKSLV